MNARRRQRILSAMGHRLALAGLVVLAGCGGSAPAPRGTPAPAARATAGPPPHRMVRFRASDGRRLHGELTPARQPRAPAVVLVHGLYGEPGQWDDFVVDLHRAGFATLAYASRSDHQPDAAVLARDVTGAVHALRARAEVDAGRIVLAGASVGGAAVTYALGAHPDLPARGGVGFSATESKHVVALAKRDAFRPHDLLLIADQREAQTARDLRADADGQGITISIAETTGHGAALLSDAGVRARAIAWLKRLTAGA
jgi:pimeloyl-ACP methyl ester carboxylesterase